MVKIDPRGEELAMFLPRFHGFSDVVARGHHLRLLLRSQNRESGAPRSVKYATINQKTHRRWQDFRHCDQIHYWRGRTLSPPTTRLPTPSQDPSRHDLNLILCQQRLRSAHRPSSTVQKISTILHQPYTIVRSTAADPSCCLIALQIDATIDNVSIVAPVS